MGEKRRRRPTKPASKEVLNRHNQLGPRRTWAELKESERAPWAPRPPEVITVKEADEMGQVVRRRRRVAA